MASIEEVQKIVDRLNDLAQRAGSSKLEAGLSVTDIKYLTDGVRTELGLNGGKVDPTKWAGLTPEEQRQHYDNLVRVADAISVLLEDDGPSDQKSIMFRAYLSNPGVILLTLIGLIGTIVTLFFIHLNFKYAVSNAPKEEDVLLMVILMGVLGGFLHLTSSFAMYVGNRHLMRSWVVYYLLMPAEGAALAVTIYLLLRVGVLSPAAANTTGSLNFIGIYGFSILAGVFSKQALEMLGSVFNVIFAKVKGKDAAPTTPPEPAAAKKAVTGQ